jgi:hypothetical protein
LAPSVSSGLMEPWEMWELSVLPVLSVLSVLPVLPVSLGLGKKKP